MKSSARKQYFKISFVMFLLLFLVFLGLQGYAFLLNKNIQDNVNIIEQQNIKLEEYKTLTGFVKLVAVKELEGMYDETPWSSHINKVISMLEEIKSLNHIDNEKLLLSDFNVDLNKISLKGYVSDLSLLYYSNESRGVVSLIDRFKNLDFIEKMYIKNYNKEKNDSYFSFILEANVIKDAK